MRKHQSQNGEGKMDCKRKKERTHSPVFIVKIFIHMEELKGGNHEDIVGS